MKAQDIIDKARGTITKPQLMHWTTTGVIIPHKERRGRGRQHEYSEVNLIEALICRELAKLSVSGYLMQKPLRKLKEPNQWGKHRWHKMAGGTNIGDASFWQILKIPEDQANWDLIPYFLTISWEKSYKGLGSTTGMIGQEGIGQRLEEEPTTIVVNLKKLIEETRK